MMKLTTRLTFLRTTVILGLFSIASTSSAQSWSTQADMKVPRVEATTIDYRDDIYVFNGFKPGIQIANSVEKYDVATKQWSIIASSTTMNGTAVTHNGVVRVGADVWIIGGRIGSHPGRVSDMVWIFNLETQNWRRGPDLPMPSAAGGAALVNNKIHWIGGIDAQARCDVATHLVYDLGAPSAGWNNITNIAAMPTPRNHFSTAVVDGIIYIMGGQFGHDGCPGKRTNDSALVHAFNPSNNNWSQKASMPSVNSHSEPGTFVYKNDIYTTGGEGAGNKVWKFDPRSNNWSTFRTLPESLVAPIARIVDGHLIVAGGGAPRAELATDTVRSMLVDNNPPQVHVETPQPPKPPEPGSNKPDGETLISMEAEYFDISTQTSTHQWIHVARGGSSNDDAMITTPDHGELAETVESTPMLSYMVNFNYSGKHYIWVRGSGDTNNSGIGNSDSLKVGLNGTVATGAYRIDQFPEEWTWSRHTPSNPVATVNVVNAGVNIVNFWMREDGLAIDKFVITSDPNFVPTGYGPALTDGTDGYVAPVVVQEDDSANEGDSENTIEPINDDAAENSDVDNEDEVKTNPIDNNLLIVANDDANAGSKGSRNGVFGGSASLATILLMFGFALVRVCRFTQTRETT